MPQFSNPLYLLLALLLPLLVWWRLRQQRGALRYPATGWLARLPPGRSRLARWGSVLLGALALLSLIIALAGPRWPDRRTRIPTEGIALVMIVDTSGSMAERDFVWDGEPISRLEAVKRAFRLFVAGGDGPDGVHLEGRGNDLIGLVTFGTRPDSPCPLTLSHSVLLNLLENEQPRSVPGESETNISDAIVIGLHRLQAAGVRRKVAVLLSDGEHNVPHPQSDWTPRQAAQIAANLGVPVYAIDAGGAGGDGMPADGGQRVEGSKTLQNLAAITRGRYFTASDTQGLLTVCQEIDRLEKQEIHSFQYRRYYEGYLWFALASFVLYVTLGGLEMTFWRRLP
jgi:Ca-activated chloride channel family protein